MELPNNTTTETEDSPVLENEEKIDEPITGEKILIRTSQIEIELSSLKTDIYKLADLALELKNKFLDSNLREVDYIG